jgi:hypothetical protein
MTATGLISFFQSLMSSSLIYFNMCTNPAFWYADDEDDNNESLLNNLNFEKFSPPALLTRHQPPATGRDDDKILKQHEVSFFLL